MPAHGRCWPASPPPGRRRRAGAGVRPGRAGGDALGQVVRLVRVQRRQGQPEMRQHGDERLFRHVLERVVEAGQHGFAAAQQGGLHHHQPGERRGTVRRVGRRPGQGAADAGRQICRGEPGCEKGQGGDRPRDHGREGAGQQRGHALVEQRAVERAVRRRFQRMVQVGQGRSRLAGAVGGGVGQAGHQVDRAAEAGGAQRLQLGRTRQPQHLPAPPQPVQRAQAAHHAGERRVGRHRVGQQRQQWAVRRGDPGLRRRQQQAGRRLRVVSVPGFPQRRRALHQQPRGDALDRVALDGQRDQPALHQRGPGVGPDFEQHARADAVAPVRALDAAGEAGLQQAHRVQEAAGGAVAGVAVDVQLAAPFLPILHLEPQRPAAYPHRLHQRRGPGAARHVADRLAGQLPVQHVHQRRAETRVLAFQEARSGGVQDLRPARPGQPAQLGQPARLRHGGGQGGEGGCEPGILTAQAVAKAQQHVRRHRGERVRLAGQDGVVQALVVARAGHAGAVAVDAVQVGVTVAHQIGLGRRSLWDGRFRPCVQQGRRVEAAGDHGDRAGAGRCRRIR